MSQMLLLSDNCLLKHQEHIFPLAGTKYYYVKKNVLQNSAAHYYQIYE